MPKLDQIDKVNFSAKQMYDLVKDVASYSEFIPWIDESEIIEESDNHFLGKLTVGFKGLNESYTSRIDFNDNELTINTELKEGAFKYLINRWKFTEIRASECEIEFFLDFELKSKLLGAMLNPLFGKANKKMIAAFKKRAQEIYA